MKHIKRLLVLSLAVLMLLPFFLKGQTANAIAGGGVAQSSYRAYGADLSSWNVNGSALNYSLIDFAKMKADGCQFVILRIGYEGSVSRANTMDMAFVEYYTRARAAGMPLGLYFYSLTTTYDGAVEDANWVADQIEKNGMYFEYPIFYDVEDSAQTALGASAMEQLCLGWCETLENRGYFPGVYGGGTQVINKLSADFKSRYDLWYPVVLNSGHGNQYDPDAYDFSDYCNMWQYAWYDCNYDGVYLDMLDVNVCYKNYPAIMSQYGYNNCEIMNTAPTVATVSLSKNAYQVDEDLNFVISANGTSTKLNIKRVDGQWEKSYDVGSYFTLGFGWKGKYEAQIVTTNAKGSKTSETIYFCIGEPTYATIKSDKTAYEVGQSATFTLDSDGAANAVTVYYPDGTSKKTKNLGTSFTASFTEPGQYQAVLESYNDIGSVQSEKISFTVSTPKPTSASVSVQKNTFKPNESVTFTCAGDGKSNTLWVYYPDGSNKYYQNVGTSKTLAFTALGKYEALVETWNQEGTLSFISQKISFTVANPTTLPTTAKPTTQKPTQPTTAKPTTEKPTTAPSVQPTTAPTTQSPCAQGHNYADGYCLNCGDPDPDFQPPTQAPATQPTTRDPGQGSAVTQENEGADMTAVLLCIVVALICVLAVAVFFLVKKLRENR